MKIFNWVHRRFHHKYEVGQDVKKAEHVENVKDKLALLENEASDSVFDGWKEGILAIGTFGFDPELLKDFEHEKRTFLCDKSSKELCDSDDDNEGYQEGEMEFPLVFKACKHGFFDDEKEDIPQYGEILKLNYHGDGVEDNDQSEMAKTDGERITLADLFWADSEKNLLKKKKLAVEDQVKISETHTKHESNDDKVAQISKKKLRKDNTTRPIKKINRMVRKMLKKKIHPDVENQKATTSTKHMNIPRSVKNGCYYEGN